MTLPSRTEVPPGAEDICRMIEALRRRMAERYERVGRLSDPRLLVLSRRIDRLILRIGLFDHAAL